MTNPKCPKCGKPQSIYTDWHYEDSHYCASCRCIWTDWQQEKIQELERENKILSLKANNSLANNLCPDHRDKQTGKPCLACTIETLERQLANEKETRIKYQDIVYKVCLLVETHDHRILVDDLYETVRIKLAETKLKWQTGKPPKDGTYWFRDRRIKNSRFVAWHDFQKPIAEYFDWAGPIPEPEGE